MNRSVVTLSQDKSRTFRVNIDARQWRSYNSRVAGFGATYIRHNVQVTVELCRNMYGGHPVRTETEVQLVTSAKALADCNSLCEVTRWYLGRCQ